MEFPSRGDKHWNRPNFNHLCLMVSESPPSEDLFLKFRTGVFRFRDSGIWIGSKKLTPFAVIVVTPANRTMPQIESVVVHLSVSSAATAGESQI